MSNGAGYRGALKAGEKLFRAGFGVHLLQLPLYPGENKCDPNSYLLNHTADDFKSIKSIEFFQSRVDSLSTTSEIHERMKAMEALANLASSQDPRLRKHYADAICKSFHEFEKKDVIAEISRAKDGPIEENQQERIGIEPTFSASFEGLIDFVEMGGEIAFLIMVDDTPKIVTQVDRNGFVYIPPPRDQIPEPIPRAEMVSNVYEIEKDLAPAEADDTLFQDLRKYFEVASELPSPMHYLLLVLWTLHTYLLDHFEYSPILTLWAVPERGKSRTGKALIYVSYRGLHTVSLRDAYLVRYADTLSGTIFFDVKDLWKKAEKAGSEDIILGRSERGTKVPRVLYPERGAFKDTVYYNVFGPTIIATNEPVHNILGTRSITVTMPQSSRSFQKNVTKADALCLKERLLSFKCRHHRDNLPSVDKVASGRLGDILRPLHQVMMLVNPTHEKEFLTLVKILVEERRTDRADSLEAKILSTMIDLAAAKDQAGNPHLVNGMLPIRTVAETFNHGLPERSQIAERRIGSVIKSLGLEKGKIHNNRGAVVWDEGKIDVIASAYGLRESPPSSPSSPDKANNG